MASVKVCVFVCSLVAVVPLLHSRRLRQKSSQSASHSNSNSSASWPRKWPWNEISLSDRRVLGEGTFGIAARYYTKCNTRQSIVVKEVKQSRNMAMHERQKQCEEAITETEVQMLMAEKDRAVRVFDLTPKDCDPRLLRNGQATYIMMARASGDGKPNPSKSASFSLMLDIAKQLMLGLNELHELGYLHRDIKPANLLYESASNIKYWEDCLPGECRFTLADYGQACQRYHVKWGYTTTCVERSCGTPLFIPPEISKSILEGDRTKDHYSRGMDYWALGITLFEMWSQLFPAQLDMAGGVRGTMKYIRSLGAYADDWWKKDGSGRLLQSRATRNEEGKLFNDILSKLLMTDRQERTDAVLEGMQWLLDKVGTSSVEIPKVCVDPCAKCSSEEQCRADVLIWQCVTPPRKLVVGVTVINDAIYGTWEYENDEGGKETFKIYRDAGKIFYQDDDVVGILKKEKDSDWLVANIHGPHASAIAFKLSETGGVGLLKVMWNDEKEFGTHIPSHLKENPPMKFTLDETNSAGETLRDLKVLVAKHFNMDVEQATFHYDGASMPLEDGQHLYEGDHIYLSPPLREAIVNGPQVGKRLASAIADAKRTRYLSFPYIDVIERINEVWPAKRWRSATRALRSMDCESQAKLADTLFPLIEEAHNIFEIEAPLKAWRKLLYDLILPLDERFKQQRKQARKETKKRCKDVGYRYCAREVEMEMDDSVDYVKVEYTYSGESPTKLKFFYDGTILKTRGDDVKDEPLQLAKPTLPGATSMKVTLCKNLKDRGGLVNALGNMFVSSESRCKQIGEPISYSLWKSFAAALPRENVTERIREEFVISKSPEVAFHVWDGDYYLN